MKISFESIKDCVLSGENGNFYTLNSDNNVVLYLDKNQINYKISSIIPKEMYIPKNIEVNEHKSILVASFAMLILGLMGFGLFVFDKFYFWQEWLGLIITGLYDFFIIRIIVMILINYNKIVDRGLFIVTSVGRDSESRDSKQQRYTIVNTKFNTYVFNGKFKTPLFPSSIVRAYSVGNSNFIKRIELLNSRALHVNGNKLVVLSLKGDRIVGLKLNIFKNKVFQLALSLFFILAFSILTLLLHTKYNAFEKDHQYQNILRSSTWIPKGSDGRFDKFEVTLNVTYKYKEFTGRNAHYDINILDKNNQPIFTINNRQIGIREDKILNGKLTFLIFEERRTKDILIFEKQNVLLRND